MEQRTYTRREIMKGGAAALVGASLALPLVDRKASALTRGVAVGVYPNGNGPLYGDFSELDAYIDLVGGVVPGLVSVFSPWVSEGSATYLYPHLDDLLLFYDNYPDSLLIWSWEPFGVTLQQISNGAHDAYIDEVARRIKAVRKRVLIRFAHEMNGHWSWPWLKQPPKDCIAAWRQIVARFRNLGATNAEWVWSPNIISYSADDFSPWYPGDAYVDWTGFDAYNWGTVHNNPWRTFQEISGDSIAETGCHSRGLNGEDKGQWYTDMATTLKRKFPNLLGLVNTHTIFVLPEEDAEWRVDMPITALDNWRTLVKDPQLRSPLRARATFGDTTAPKVTAVTPQRGATGVSPSANVSATFSEAMKASTINATTIKLFRKHADGTESRVAATVTYNRTGKKAGLNPNNNLRLGATYKVAVGTGANDLAGNALDRNRTKKGNQGKTWKFTVRKT